MTLIKMSDDRYASDALSDLIDSPNIYPVRGLDKGYPVRSTQDEPAIRRNNPSSPVRRFDFDDDEDEDDNVNSDISYNDTSYNSEYESVDEDDYLRSPIQRSPIQRSPIQRSPIQRSPIQRSPIQRSPIQRSPMYSEDIDESPVIVPVGNRNVLDSLTEDYSDSTPPPVSRVPSASSSRVPSSRVPSGSSSRVPSSSSSRVPSGSSSRVPSGSSSRVPSGSSSRVPSASRTPTSHVSRVSSPRSILFPSDEKQANTTKSNNIDDLLISNGYVPVKMIVVDNAVGKSDYILAVNKRGQYVLVSLDGKDKKIEGDIIHTEIIKGGSSIPYSAKKGAFECANGVCGVAYDSDNELNIVTRDEFSMEPRSDTLIYKGDNVASIGNNVPIPVISYNDIVHDPVGVLKNSYEITDRLHKNEYEHCKEGMVETSTEFKSLESALKSYMLLEVALGKELAMSMSQLRSFASQYERDPPVDEKERENYNLVKFNLRKRSDLFITLINCCSQVSGMKSTFVELTKKIHELHEMCEREFSGVSHVMTP